MSTKTAALVDFVCSCQTLLEEISLCLMSEFALVAEGRPNIVLRVLCIKHFIALLMAVLLIKHVCFSP